MITLEQVEYLRKHANVSYAEAKEALEASGEDLLEAVIYLENNGKTEAPENGGYYKTGEIYIEENGNTKDSGSCGQSGEPTFGRQMERLWACICELVRKGNHNFFQVDRHGKSVMSVPVNLLILALIFGFWITLPALVIGLFFGCRYKFNGAELGKDSVNNVMDGAADTAESLKKSFKG